MRIALGRTLWLTIASVAGRLPGFLVPVLVAAVFGAGTQTDAYFLAYNAVLLVAGTLAQNVEMSIVPFAARELLQSELGARRFLTRTAVRFSAVAAGLWLVVVPVLLAIAGGAVRSQVLWYAVCFTPLVLFWSAASVHSGALVAERDIAAATGSMLWRGAGGLAGLALAPAGAGLWGVALGLGMGEMLRTFWIRHRVLAKVRQHTDIETAPLVPFPHAAAAMVVAGFLMSIVPLAEKLLALKLGPGSASHLEYATRVLVVPAVLFDGALAPQLLAGWSRSAVADGHVPTRPEVWGAARRGLLLAGGLAVLVALFAPQLVSLLLRHGRFSAADAAQVSALLRVLTVGFVGSMGSLLAAQAYLASARTKAFAWLTLLRGAMRVGIAVALLRSLGLLAFGVGFSVAEWCFFVALLIACRPAPIGALAPREAEA